MKKLLQKLTSSQDKKDIIIIKGTPVDVFALNDIVIKTSPSDMKTVLRYDTARIVESIMNVKRAEKEAKAEPLNWGLIILLLVVAGAAVGGIFFAPQIIDFLTGMFGGLF